MRLVILLSVMLCMPAKAGWFGSQSFEECVEDSTSALTPKFASNVISLACRGDTWSSTENECLIDSLEGVRVDFAARMIRSACQGNFSKSVKSCLLRKMGTAGSEQEARKILSRRRD